MNDTTLGRADEPQTELGDIEFESPGCFSVHNPLHDTAAAVVLEPAAFVLGQHTAWQRLNGPAELRSHALSLLLQAQRSLCLYTPDLEPWLYHHASMQTACSRFLLASPKKQLRILLRDSQPALREGHLLLNLARRLSSNLQIRKLNPDYPAEEIAFLLADDQGLLLRQDLEQQAGYVIYSDPGRARLRQAQFDQAWDLSHADPDLRSLLI